MRWTTWLLYLSLLGYGIGFAFAPTIFSGFKRLQTDPGDTVLNHCFLEHSLMYVSQRDYRGTLWSPIFFYPEKDVLGYSDNLFGAAPVYWLLRAVCDEVLAYQLWMMLGFAINFLVMAIVLRWFGLNHSLCALGAFLFAFGTPHVQQIGHQQLSYRCWTPLAIWFAWRFLEKPTGRSFFLCLLCITWQFIAVVYAGWFLAFGLGCMGLIRVVFEGVVRRRVVQFVKQYPLTVLGSLAFNGSLAAAIVIPYLRANRGFTREFSEVLQGSPHWYSWLSVPPGALWFPLLKPLMPELNGEGYLFGGLACVILLLIGIWALFRRESDGSEQRVLIRTFLLTTAVLFLLTLSIWDGDKGGTVWYSVYHIVPGAKAIRCTARIYMIFYPFLIIAGLIGLQRILVRSRLSETWKAILQGSLILLAVLENYFPQMEDRYRSFEHAWFYGRARQLSAQIQGADAAGANSALQIAFYENELMMMWASLYSNTPVMNGYSGRWPDGYPFLQNDFSRPNITDWLGKNWRGKIVIVTNGADITREVWRVEHDGTWRRLE